MLWLIKTDLAPARKPHLRNGTPACLLYFRALNAFLRKRGHLGFQIVAHKIEFVSSLLGGVERDFGGRESEYQPAMTCVDGFESQDFAELRDEYICSWCEIREGHLLAFPRPNSRCEIRRFPYPREADIVGRVTGVAMRLVEAHR